MRRKIFKRLLLTAMIGGAVLLAAPVIAQQGSASAGQTVSDNARYLKAPEAVGDLVVTAVDLENGKVRLQHQSRGWDLWFQLDEDTVIRNASNKKTVLALSELEAGQEAEVFIARKPFRGKTVYLDVQKAEDC